MGRIMKLLFYLAGFGLIALTGYAYLWDLRPSQRDISEPVSLNVN